MLNIFDNDWNSEDRGSVINKQSMHVHVNALINTKRITV